MSKRLVQWICDYEGERGLAYNFRKNRSKLFKQFVEKNFGDAPIINIIDLGGTETFWKSVGLDYLREKNIQITLVNIVPEPVEHEEIFTSVAGDACHYETDQDFDICFSNSCIEHVGQMTDFIDFRNSAQRLAKTYFIQTPSYHFPLEPHFVTPGWHWLPKSLRVFIVQHMAVGHFGKAKDYLDSYVIVESCYLLSYKIFKTLFHDAKIHREKIGFMTKSYIAVKELSPA